MPKPCRLASVLTLAPALFLSSSALGAASPHAANTVPEPLVVDHGSDARHVLEAVPAGSALERFEALADDGHLVSYVGLTETDYGGLVFVDQRLIGSITREQAQAFYACRGYVTAMGNPWSSHADAWVHSLMNATQPLDQAQLKFSGATAAQSIQQLVSNPAVVELNDLVSMGTNPLNIFKRLSDANHKEHLRQRHEKEQAALKALSPGSSEQALSAAAKTQVVGFLSDGLILSYPTHLLEFYVSKQKVQTIQQPSFYELARVQPAVFYVANTDWSQCTPQAWQHAVAKGQP